MSVLRTDRGRLEIESGWVAPPNGLLESQDLPQAAKWQAANVKPRPGIFTKQAQSHCHDDDDDEEQQFLVSENTRSRDVTHKRDMFG